MRRHAANHLASRRGAFAAAIARLRSRRAEMIQEIDAGIKASPPFRAGPEMHPGSRAALITATVDYNLNALETEWHRGPIPKPLAAHARNAARRAVQPWMLVCCYLAGHERFMEFVRDEVGQGGQAGDRGSLEHLNASCQLVLSHIISSMEGEYERELRTWLPEQHQAALVRRVLVDDLDADLIHELDYDLLRWHTGMIATGTAGAEALERLKGRSGQALMCVPGENGSTWAWLARDERFTFAQLSLLLKSAGCADAPLMIGDSNEGPAGFRQTHEEARIAEAMSPHPANQPVRCADILPIASALQSKAILKMYKTNYILPLNQLFKEGAPTRKALSAYFSNERSATSAAEAINVTDRTIRNHLREAQKALGAPLNLTGLEIALQLEERGFLSDEDQGPPLDLT